MTSQSAFGASGVAGAVGSSAAASWRMQSAIERRARSMAWVRAKLSSEASGTGKTVQREVRALPSPAPASGRRRDGVHRPRAGGRGRSAKRNAGHRAPSLATAACGVAPSVKNP